MKKLFIIVGVMLIVAMAGLALVACSGSNDGNGSDDTYYEVKGYGSSSTLNESSWIKLKNGKWSDDDGESGTYKLNGEKITIIQDGEEWMTGTLKDGTLELEIWGMPAGTYRTKGAQEKISGSSSSSGSGNGSSSSSGSDTSSGENNSGSGSSGDQSGSIDKEPEKEIITKKLSLYNLDGTTTTKEIEIGKMIGTLPLPVQNNYSFLGWETIDGERYTSSSLMPSFDLELYPMWEKKVPTYVDNFLTFSPARQGYKNELAFLYGSQYGAEKYLYVEITPDNLAGSIDASNNFSLRNLKNLNYSVSEGYTAMWYQGNFNNPNGAQRFSLGYGSNMQLITVIDSSGTVQCTYLLDLYVLRNYTVSFYKTIYDTYPYNYASVSEGDCLSITTRGVKKGDFEFDRWIYYDEDRDTYSNFSYATKIMSDISLYQSYKPYTISCDLSGGSLDAELSIEPYKDFQNLPIPSKKDYDFLGWKKPDGKFFTDQNGSSKRNYFSNSTGTLTAAWEKKIIYYGLENDVFTTKVTELKSDLLENGSIGSIQHTVLIDDEIIAVDNENSAPIGSIVSSFKGKEGYTLLGWYDGDDKKEVSFPFELTEISISYRCEWIPCPVVLIKNIEEAGVVRGVEGATVVGAMITITAETNPGYTWIGWYDGNEKINEGTTLSYSFNMPSERKEYIAKWSKVVATKNLEIAGAITTLTKQYYVGERVTISAEVNPGYVWLGWYDEETKVSEGSALHYTFEMSGENKVFTARYALCTNHTPNESCICSSCGAISHMTDSNCICINCNVEDHAAAVATNGYCRHNDYIYFGTYPQTLLTDDVVSNVLTSAAGLLPTVENNHKWTFCENSEGNYKKRLWYLDQSYGSNMYRGVYSENDSITWFKYEPIKWRILEESNGEAMLFSESIIDYQVYQGSYSETRFSVPDDGYPTAYYYNTSDGTPSGIYQNNYYYSSIRQWLNDVFYDTAFSLLQKDMIKLTLVDNSIESIGSSPTLTVYSDRTVRGEISASAVTCQNTNDYVFLLSIKDVYNAGYGFKGGKYYEDPNRAKASTDYALSLGGDRGHWFLRSPVSDYYKTHHGKLYPISTGLVFRVSDGGEAYNGWAASRRLGVVPALRIKL